MKNLTPIITSLVAAILLTACNSNPKVYKASDLKNISDSASYLSGVLTGEQMRKDTLYKINIDVYIAGIKEAYSKDSGFAIAADQRQAVFQRLQQEMDKKLSKLGDEFLANIEKNKTVQKLDGGVLLEVISEGSGDFIAIDDSVSFHMLLATNNNPKVFNTREDSKYPVPFTKTIDLGPTMIEGLPLAMSKMKVGGEYRVYIPFNVGKLRGAKPGDVSILNIGDLVSKKAN
jgi:FKBP-type peptidyl-prolyl cis-trans isomerase